MQVRAEDVESFFQPLPPHQELQLPQLSGRGQQAKL